MKSLRPFALVVVGIAMAVGTVAETAPKCSRARQSELYPAAMKPIKDERPLPRVLLIGDSVSIGYTLATRRDLAGEANVHRVLDNCRSTTYGVKHLDEWLGDGRWDVIHFNWGMHDLTKTKRTHQVPLEQYKQNLQRLVRRLKSTDAELIWCSTTPAPKNCRGRRANEDVIVYNAVAKKFMDAHGIVIHDLYAYALPRLDEMQCDRDVHFSREGSQALGEQVAVAVRRLLAN